MPLSTRPWSMSVEQGRIIYANILRFIHYLFSCNMSEILTVFVVIMIGRPLPLGALQLLWLNMITDIFPALALALEPSSPDAMRRPPRDPKEPLLTVRFVGLISWQGVLLAAVTLIAFEVGLSWYGTEPDSVRRGHHGVYDAGSGPDFPRLQRSVSEAFRIVAAFYEWLAVGRGGGVPFLLQVAAVSVPLLQQVLQTVMPTLAEWGVIVSSSLAPILVVELIKAAQRRRSGASAPDLTGSGAANGSGRLGNRLQQRGHTSYYGVVILLEPLVRRPAVGCPEQPRPSAPPAPALPGPLDQCDPTLVPADCLLLAVQLDRVMIHPLGVGPGVCSASRSSSRAVPSSPRHSRTSSCHMDRSASQDLWSTCNSRFTLFLIESPLWFGRR